MARILRPGNDIMDASQVQRGGPRLLLVYASLAIVIGFCVLADATTRLYGALPMALFALCPVLVGRPRPPVPPVTFVQPPAKNDHI
jgi:hypothetical protein